MRQKVKKRIRRKISLLISCSLLLSSSVFMDIGSITTFASALAEESDDSTQTDQETGYTYILYQETENGETVQKAEITGYTGSETDLVIPARVASYDVGRIGNMAFQGNQDITGVTISEGVKGIGYEAFSGCEQITHVEIPSTITTWLTKDIYDNKAFQGCTSLTDLTLAEGLTVLGQMAFQNCTSLESVTVPSTITTFGNKVFYNCTSLQNLVLQEGIREMGHQAFGTCTSLEEVTIPSTITKWDTVHFSGQAQNFRDCAPFADCTSLKKIVLPEGLKTLSGFQGSRGCPLITELEVPSSVENIDYAFTDCTYLQKITLPEGLETIGVAAFKGCSALTDMRIPGTVTKISKEAFDKCTSLERLVFPPSASNLEELIGITSYCDNLKELCILAEDVQYYQKPFNRFHPATAMLYCTSGSSTYGKYQEGMKKDGMEDRLAVLPDTGAKAEGHSAVYDGKAHDAVTVTGTRDGDEILYRMDGEDTFRKECPQITEPGSYNLEVYVSRMAEEGLPCASLLQVQAQIRKKDCRITLTDVEAVEKEDYTVSPSQYEGDAVLTYTYYRDEALTEVCGEKPTAPGIYYVKAEAAETAYYTAAESNVAKITIREADKTPGTDPGTSTGTAPGTDPGTSTGTTPGTDPGAATGTTPSNDPGTAAGPTSGAGIDPTCQGAFPVPPSDDGQKVTVKRAVLRKVSSPSRRTLQVRWEKMSGVSGYQVCVGQNRKMTKGKKTVTISGNRKTTATIRKLTSKKVYYVKVRAYKTVEGKPYYGNWSSVKKKKVK